MQFVKNGPNVPEKLLQAHEEGKVVFFCGAGISFPAKLPGFGSLVWNLYEKMGVMPNDVQLQALKSSQFDTAVSLLEAVKSTNEWRHDVRKAMADLLKPDYKSSKATSTHEALLQLATTNENKVRLITTNFDRIFQKVKEETKLDFSSYKAPLLPVPKNRWDGLVYLHGLLPEEINGFDLDHLVVSSGDFGLAYLTERWAARFVSELFRSYTVCFVGYSLNDPVLRYMMDALAADRLLGESPPEMYAFGNYKASKNGREGYEKEEQYWLAKNVTPILYKNYRNHYYLHETLAKWSETYRDGLSGKEQIVVTTAFSNPSNSDLHNDIATRLAWALSDPTGIPAKKFSNLNPTPSLDWLEVLNSIKLKREDLSRFGIPESDFQEDYNFSLFNRPAPSHLSPNMTLANPANINSNWDKVMEGLGNWVTRHLNNPELVLFILKHGSVLNSQLLWKVTREIENQREKANDAEYFDKLKTQSPSAVISEHMFKVWSLVLNGYCDRSTNSLDLYSWGDKYKYSSLTISLKKELRSILSPKISFRKPYESSLRDSKKGIKGLLEWDVNLAASFVHSSISELEKIPNWKIDISLLLPDFYALLLETMELMEELGDVEEFQDYSYIHHPSIKQHPQNRDFNDWTALIDLLRDSWLSLKDRDGDSACNAVITWWRTPYPVFKRMALFAAAESDLISIKLINLWLMENDSRWLWNTATHREVFQLIPVLVEKMEDIELYELLANICKGPERKWFKDDLSDDDFCKIKDREVWSRLEKCIQSGAIFNDETATFYQSLKGKYPQWELRPEEKDEFPFWMGDGDDLIESVSSPTDQDELAEWLKKFPEHDRWDQDDWPLRCKSDFRASSYALKSLLNQDIWIPERWREALHVWTEDEALSKKARRYLLACIFEITPEKLVDISWNLSSWLKGLQKGNQISSERFLLYFDLLIELPYQFNIDDVNDPLTSAINHPVGILTESLFLWWYGQKPIDNEGGQEQLKVRLNRICESNEPSMYLGKVIAATNMLSLYRVDPGWTSEKLLPWLDWENSELANMSWQAYLWSPRLHKAFLVQVKRNLLDTARHYESLGELKEQYARFITSISLQSYGEFKASELASVFDNLPSTALIHVASTLNDGMSGSGDKYSEYWEHRIKQFLRKAWPKNVEISDMTVNQLALLCINTKLHFEEAFGLLKHSLREYDDTEYLVRQLNNSEVIGSFPRLSLEFLNLVIAEPRFRAPSKLGECLSKIIDLEPELESAQAYRRLITIVRQHENE